MSFAVSITIDKDGTYSSTFNGQIVDEDLFPEQWVQKSSGIWKWVDQGKNKSAITRIDNATGQDNFITGEFRLIKLSGTDMKMVREGSYSSQAITSSALLTTKYSEVVEFEMTKEEE